jgi:hypothetical protein
MIARLISSFILCVVIAIVHCSPAEADAGVPMLAIVWPWSWVLLPVIIVLEAMVAACILKINVKQCFALATIANLISTLVGIPVTWIVLLIFEILTEMLFWIMPWLRSAPIGFILETIMQTPWLGPLINAPDWLLPTYTILLCVPFFLMSVWVEYLVAKFYLRDFGNRKLILRWSWMANSLSYGLIIIGLLWLALFGHISSEDPRWGQPYS